MLGAQCLLVLGTGVPAATATTVPGGHLSALCGRYPLRWVSVLLNVRPNLPMETDLGWGASQVTPAGLPCTAISRLHLVPLGSWTQTLSPSSACTERQH